MDPTYKQLLHSLQTSQKLQDTFETFSNLRPLLPSAHQREFYLDTKTTADKINERYKKNLSVENYLPSQISVPNFSNTMKKWLSQSNVSYKEREKNKQGLYYAEDYVNLYAQHTDIVELLGLVNHHYWSTPELDASFQGRPNLKPSEMMTAFFFGPTFADCGSVINACVLRTIEEMIGTVAFDRYFSKPLTPFLVSPILFNAIPGGNERPDLSLRKRCGSGNPLMFLFDSHEKNFADSPICESEVQVGDILHIAGVTEYTEKHLVGSGIGWNLMCAGKTAQGKNLYLGFGPNSFSDTLDYASVKSLLIQYYNFKQNNDTAKRIKHFHQASDIKHDNPGQMLNYAMAQLAYSRRDHTVSNEHPIGGIRAIIRFNPDKLQHFLSKQKSNWYFKAAQQPVTQIKPIGSKIKHVTEFSKESFGKTFADYHAETDTQKRMLQLAQSFANEVVTSSGDLPLGLVMTGLPGIGKTHLGVAIADYASQHNLKVLYVDDSTIGNKYQEWGEKMHTKVLADLPDMTTTYQQWVKDSDLIVLDDINTEFGSAYQFFTVALRHVIDNNKAIFVSSNMMLERLTVPLQEYYGLDEPKANGFYVIQGLDGISYRNAWWSEDDAIIKRIKRSSASHNVLLRTLIAYKGHKGAAVILESKKKLSLDKVQSKLLKLSGNRKLKIRKAKAPYRNQYVYDMYMHDADQYTHFIIEVNNTSQAKQFLELMSKVHDAGKKVVIVSRSAAHVERLVEKVLTSHLMKNYKLRLLDRFNNLVLIPAKLDKTLH